MILKRAPVASTRTIANRGPSILTDPLMALQQLTNYSIPYSSVPVHIPGPIRPMMPVFHRLATRGGIHFTLALDFPSLSRLLRGTTITTADTSHGDLLMIRWTVARKANSGPGVNSNSTGQSWQSVTHFSTLPNGWIPDGGVDFVKQFLDQLRVKWLRLCEDGENLLSDSVRPCVMKPEFLSSRAWPANKSVARPNRENACSKKGAETQT
jgi:hypothetical protein